MAKAMRGVLLFSVLVGLTAFGGDAGAVAQGETASGVVVEAARQVTADPNPVRLYSNPALAVDPDDPSTVVVAVADARNGGCGVKVSHDGGLSWATPVPTVMPSGLPYCVQRNFGPALAPVIASDGTLYIGVSGSSAKDTPNGPISALVVRSGDLGSNPETVTVARPEGFTYTPPAGGQSLTGFNQWREPTLAVDPSNPKKLYMGWRLWNGGIDSVPFAAFPQRSYISTSDDGGRTWTQPLDVLKATIDEAEAKELGIVFNADRVTQSDTPQLVVAKDGTVYGFTKEQPPSVPAGQPAPVSRLFMFKSTDGGKTWSTSVVNKGAQRIDLPSAAIDPRTGALYLAYASRGAATPTGTPANPSKVYVTASADGGKTWSDPQVITDDDPVRKASQYFPGISVAPNGRVDVAWYDFRNDAFFNPGEEGNMGSAVGQRYWDAYYSSSGDGGRSWAENTRITAASIDSKAGITFNNQDVRAAIAVGSTNEGVYLAWPDTRASGPGGDAEDVYFSRVRFAAPLPLGASTDRGSKVAWGLAGAAITLALGGAALLFGARRFGGGERTQGTAVTRDSRPASV
jgi:hypothetical protein